MAATLQRAETGPQNGRSATPEGKGTHISHHCDDSEKLFAPLVYSEQRRAWVANPAKCGYVQRDMFNVGEAKKTKMGDQTASNAL